MVENKRSSSAKPIVLAMILSTVAMAVNYLISFLLTPYITRTLGTEAYGFVTLTKTIANYGIILTTCFNAYSARFIVVSYHEGNLEKAKTYYSSVLIANIVLFVLVCSAFVIIATKLEMLISIPDELINDVKILFVLNGANFMLMTLANVNGVTAYIKNKLHITYSIKIVVYLTEAFVIYSLFLHFPPKVYYVGIGLLASSAVLGILNTLMKNRYAKNLEFNYRLFSFQAVKDLVARGAWSAFNQVGNALNTGLDLLVSNLMLSAIAMGELSIVKTLASIFSTIPNLICQPFKPTLLKEYAKGDIDSVVRVMKTEIKIMGLVAYILIVGFYILGKDYYHLWTPEQNTEKLFWLTIVTILGFLCEAVSVPLYYAYTLALKNMVASIVIVSSGTLNVLGMYFLIKYTDLELFAVVGTTSVLAFFTCFIFAPLYSARCLRTNRKTFYPTIIRTLISGLIIFIVGNIVFGKIGADNWFELIVWALVITMVLSPLYCLAVLSKREWKTILNVIKKG